MKCANQDCSAETLYFRSGKLYAADVLGASGSGERRLIWLCDVCAGKCSVETWRPPGEQVRLSGSLPARPPLAAENWN